MARATGRCRVFGVRSTKRGGFSLTPKEHAFLHKFAKDRGVSLAHVARSLTLAAINDRGERSQAAIDKIKTLLADL